MKIRPLDELVVEDDAGRHLDSLSDEERAPRFAHTSLSETGESFTLEEIEAAFQIFAPE